jgi:HPt (histidine-containing phosphotransfer) domain-containing protein
VRREKGTRSRPRLDYFDKAAVFMTRTAQATNVWDHKIVATQPPAFDIAHIIDQWGSPLDEIYGTILDIFVIEAEALCAEARSSLAAGRRDTLARAVHTLGGASANIGAMHLASCAGAVEALAQSAEGERLESMLKDVEAAWAAVLAEIATGGPKLHG